MKTYLALIAAAALSLAACSQEPAQKAESNEPATEASAPAEAASTPEDASVSEAAHTEEAVPADSAAAPAADCAATISAGDDMKFDSTDININKSCKEFTLTLKHSGKMPKTAMGHNIVITKAEDVDDVDKDGAAAGVDNNYVKPDDSRVVSYTKLIGGGEEDTITIDVSKFAAGNQYEFFCSFPGHIAMMRGNVNVN